MTHINNNVYYAFV